MRKISEKGQSMVEYALILVIIAIVVIATTTILIEKLTPDQTTSILSDSPVIGYEKTSPSLIGLGVVGDASVTIKPGCHLIYINSEYDLKTGTQYPHVDELSVARADNTHYQFCSQVPASEIKIQIEYIKKQ